MVNRTILENCNKKLILKYLCVCTAIIIAGFFYVYLSKATFHPDLRNDQHYDSTSVYRTNDQHYDSTSVYRTKGVRKTSTITKGILKTMNITYFQKLQRLQEFNITPILLDPMSLKWLKEPKTKISILRVGSPPIIVGVNDLAFMQLPTVKGKANIIHSNLSNEVNNNSTNPFKVCIKLSIGRTQYLLLVIQITTNFTFVPACNTYQDTREGPWVPILGKKPLVFDRFALKTYRINGLTLAAPGNISKYLLEFPKSTFIRCRRDTPSNVYKNEPPDTTQKQLKGAVYLKEKLQNLGRFASLSFGSLLGWYRQCHFIHNTGDFDFNLHSKDLDKSLHESICKDPNIQGKTLNIPTDGFQYFLWVLGARIDVFFLYNTTKKDLLYTNGFVRPNSRLGWYHKKRHECSGILLGHRFNVPCEIEDAVTMNYGKNWAKQGGGAANFKMFPPWPKDKLPYAYVDLKDCNKLSKFFVI